MADEIKSSDELKPRGQKRVNVETKVNMEFERFSGFISEYSQNISEGGMFVKTDAPQPVGSVFSFEFRLRDDIKLIQGWGEVVWVRSAGEENAEQPAGMGIKFIDLDEESRNLIKRIIKTREKAGDDGIEVSSIEGREPDGVMTVDHIPVGGDDNGPSIESSIVDELGDQPMGDVASNLDDIVFADADSKTERIGEDEVPSFEEMLAGDGEVIDEGVVEEEPAPKSRSILPFFVLLVVIIGVGVGGFFFKDQLSPLLAMVGLGDSPASVEAVPTAPVAQVPPETPEPPKEAAEPPAEVVEALPTEEPEPVAEPQATPEVTGPLATSLVDVKLAQSGAAGSVFELELNGRLTTDLVKMFEVPNPPPRLVIDIGNVNKPFSKRKISVSDSRVRSLRLGVHRNPDKIRVVFDLKAALSGKSSYEIEGKKLRVFLN